MLELNPKKNRKVYEVQLSGELTRTTSDDFLLFCDELINEGYNVLLLDCSELEYVSSRGISALISLQKKAEQHMGSLSACCLNQENQSLFSFLGITESISTYNNREEALSALKSSFSAHEEAHARHSGHTSADVQSNDEVNESLRPSSTSIDEEQNEGVKSKNTETEDSLIELDEELEKPFEIIEEDIHHGELKHAHKKKPNLDHGSDPREKQPLPVEPALSEISEDDTALVDSTTTSTSGLKKESMTKHEEVARDEHLDSGSGIPLAIDAEAEIASKEDAARQSMSSHESVQTAVLFEDEKNPDHAKPAPVSRDELEEQEKDFILYGSEVEVARHIGGRWSQPLIVECENCSSLIKVRRSGTHLCAECKKQFKVYPDKSWVF